MTTPKKPPGDTGRKPKKKTSNKRSRPQQANQRRTLPIVLLGGQPAETVPVSVDVPKGMVLMAVTAAEADELARNRFLASGGRLFRLLPRDWTTPLALLVPLAAVLVTDISNEDARTAFVVATVIAFVWLVLSLIARAMDAAKAKSYRERSGPVLQ